MAKQNLSTLAPDKCYYLANLEALVGTELNLKKHVTTICAKAMNSINRD